MNNPGKTGPSRAWFILPTVLLLAAALLAGFGISSFLSYVRSDFSAYQPGSSISVTTDGFTLYAADDGTREAADLSCTATGPDGQVPLAPVGGQSTRSNGQRMYLAVASSPRSLPAGRYVISCENTMAEGDVPLYIGPRVDLAALGRLVVLGVIAPLFLGVCSVALFAILAFLRYRSRRIAT